MKTSDPMRTSRRRLLHLGLAAGATLLPGLPLALAQGAVASERLPVVASFSILGDMVQEVGGEDVALTVIVPAGRDAHTFEPTPSDARALKEAKVLVINGLDFELWLPRLLQAADFKGAEIVASDGVVPREMDEETGAAHRHDADGHDHEEPGQADGHGRHHHAGVDPHAWQNLANGVIYVQNIATGLAAADPAHAAAYHARADAYVAKLRAANARWIMALAAVPKDRRVLVTSHDAFGYFGAAYGIEVLSVVGLSTAAEPSARKMADLIREIRKHHITALFLERGAPPRALQQVSKETGAKLDGTLYADTLDAPGGQVTSYLGMFEWNTQRLLQAFTAP